MAKNKTLIKILADLRKTNKVLVGRDVRESSPEIFEYLCKRITDSGADVFNIGLSTTPWYIGLSPDSALMLR